MRIPRLNRLTGFRWWQSTPVRDDSEASRLRQEAAIQAMILQPGPCAIGKIGTSELLVLEYPHRWIRPPWPAPASWHRPTERLFHSGGLFPLEKRIFKRFYRMHGPLATRVKGMGLGLFIVRSVARRHGGRAWAESAGPGRGSTFIVQLPLAK